MNNAEFLQAISLLLETTSDRDTIVINANISYNIIDIYSISDIYTHCDTIATRPYSFDRSNTLDEAKQVIAGITTDINNYMNNK